MMTMPVEHYFPSNLHLTFKRWRMPDWSIHRRSSLLMTTGHSKEPAKLSMLTQIS